MRQFCALMLLVFSTAFSLQLKAAVSISPSPSTGSFTVSWDAHPSVRFGYRIIEIYGGSSTTYSVSIGTLSKSFTKTANGSYTYEVIARGEYYNALIGEYFPKDYSAGSATVTVTVPLPGTPSSISVPGSTDTDGAFSVSWGSSSGIVTRYEVRESKNGSWGSWVSTGTSRSKTYSGRGDGTYRYQARACNDSGCGSAKTSGYFDVLKAPGTPSSITVPSGTDGDGSYTVTWGAASGTVARYEYRESKNGSWGSWASNGTSRSKPLSGRTDGTYQYQVKACNATGCGGSRTSGTFSVLNKPGTPSSITVPTTTDTDGAYTISWGASSGVVDRYEYRESKNGTWGSWFSNGTSRSKPLSGRENGTYQYQARACNDSGCGGAKTSGTFNVLKKPGTPASISVPTGYHTSASVSISWGASSGTVDRYEYRQEKSGSWGSWASNATSRSKTIGGLTEAEYAYQVRACNTSGCGSTRTSGTFTILFPPSGTSGLAASVTQTISDFDLSWSAASGVISHYKIEEKYESGDWADKTTVSSGSTAANLSVNNPGQYQYRVSACNAAACGGVSNTVTLAATAVMVEPTPSDGSYTLTWASYDANNGVSYRVTETFGSTVVEESLSKYTQSKTYEKTKNGTYHYLVEQYVDVSGDGSQLQWYTVGSVSVDVALPHPGPVSLTVSSEHNWVNDQVVVGYTPLSDVHVNAYELEYSSGGAWAPFSQGNFTLSDKATYTFRVRAVNDSGPGPWAESMANSYEKPIPPTLFANHIGEDREVDLRWEHQGGDFDYFTLSSATDANFQDPGQLTGNSYTVPNVTSGRQEYQLAACLEVMGYCSEYSEPAFAHALSGESQLANILGLAAPTVDTVFSLSEDEAVAIWEGKLSVNGGAVNYSFPIALPPGRRGMQPSLSVAYSSQAGYGNLGTGWSIGTGGSVSRCPKIFAIEGQSRPVSFDENDALCIDGVRLIGVSGVYGRSGAVYAPETYDGSEVIQKGGDIDSGSAFFEVKTKSNHTVYYGQTSDSVLTPAGAAAPLSWKLSRREDAFGNNVTWAYENVSGEHRVDEIRYTGYQSEVGSRKVDFVYESSNRYREQYIAGGKSSMGSRLQKLAVSINGTPGHEYQFGYASEGELDRLETLSFCPTSTTCTTNTIEWGDSESLLGSSVPAVDLVPYPSTDSLETRAIGGRDFDGDGQFDIWARGQGFFLSSEQAWVPDLDINDLTSMSNQFDESRIDINLDGKDDLLFTTPEKELKYATWNASTGKFDVVPTGAQSQCEYAALISVTPSVTSLVNFCESAVSDVDGDGAIDVLMPYEKLSETSYTYRLYQNVNGTLEYKAQFEAGAFGALSMRDLDGDGVKDVLVNATTLRSDSKIYWRKVTTAGESWSVSSERTTQIAQLSGSRDMDGRTTIKWADVNGDGLQDLLALSSQDDLEYEWYYALNRGDGSFTSFSATGLPEFALIRTQPVAGGGFKTSHGAFAWNHLAFAVDINHDGIEDLMAPSGIANKAFCENGTYENNPCNIDTELEGAPVQYDVYEWSAYIATYDENGLSYTEQALGIRSHRETLFQADVNADGVMDYGSYLGASGKTYTYRGPEPGVYTYLGNRDKRDLVVGLKLADDRLEKHRFHYGTLVEKHLEGERVYTPNDQPKAYPYTNFINSMRVVKSVESDNGVGGFNEERYTYQGAVANLQGRGFAGFRKITREEVITGNRDVTVFQQSFPYGGILESRQQFTGDDVLFFDYLVEGQSDSFGQPAGTYMPRVTNDTTKEYEIADSALLSTVETTAGFDALGNQTSGSVTESDRYGESSIVTNAEFGAAASCRNTPVYSEARSQRSNLDVGAGALNASEQVVRTDYSDFESCLPKRTELTATDGGHAKINTLTLDQYGNVLTATQHGDAEANRIVTSVYEPEGYFVEASYNNEWGNGVLSQQSTNPWFGVVDSTTDMLGRRSNTSLNDFGQPLSLSSDMAPTTQSRQTWCDASCPQYAVRKSVKWTKGSVPVTEYLDSLNRVIQTTAQGFDGRVVVSNKVYNARGYLTRTEEPHFEGNAAAYETWTDFDDLGRAREHQRYSNPLSFTTTYGYSGTGVTVSVVNGTGSALSMVKAFAANKKLAYTQDALGGKTYYRYDGAGRLISLVDAASNDTVYEYNGFGELTAVDDPNAGRSVYSYNAFGERDVSTDANGKVTDTFYDKLGRVIGSVNGGDTIARMYDQNGLYGLLTTEARNEEYIRLFDYQPVTLHPSATYTVIDGDKEFVEQTLWDTQYHRPAVTQSASGDVFRARYNPRGFQYQHEHYQPDQSWTATWTLDDTTASGAPVLQRFMSGIEQKITRYSGSEIIDDICTGGFNCLQSDQIQSIDYRHDAWGNVEGERHQHNGLDYGYTFDALHRLDTQTVTSSDYPMFNRSIDYDYDAVGNMLLKSDYASSLQYGNQGRSAGGNAGPHAVHTVTTLDGQGHSLVYDNAGNVITGLNGLSVGYDNFNQANRIERNGIVTEYQYGTGIDAYKKVETDGGITTTTLYVGDFEHVSKSSGIVQERLTYGGYLVITRENTSQEQGILLKDRLGSVTTIVDASKQPGESGFVKQFRSYDPFGQSRDFQGQDQLTSLSTTDQGFTGHRHLNDQSLIHMRGRVYDYQLGRFLSPDPFIMDPTDSQSLNAYSYVLNNPLSGTDPTGYQYNTGQDPNTRSPGEATPTTEEGSSSQKQTVVKGKVRYRTPGSRIIRESGSYEVEVSGNGAVESVSFTNSSGQASIAMAGGGAHAGQSGSGAPDSGGEEAKIGLCGTAGKCRPNDYSAEEQASILERTNRVTAEIRSASYDSVQAAAVALHENEGLMAMAEEYGVEFWAVIDKKTFRIKEVATGFHSGKAEGVYSNSFKLGDSVWHTHPSGKKVWKGDLHSVVGKRGRWIFASGRKLSGIDSYTTGYTRTSQINADYGRGNVTRHLYSGGEWSTEQYRF